VDCLLLAAGRSERMGKWKPMLPFRGSTILETAVRTALGVCSRVILVAGYRAEELPDRLRSEPRVRIVVNPRWELGMFSSIKTGVPEIEAPRFFIALGDMPFLESEVYTALLDHPEADAVFPVHGGRRGHPVLFRASVKAHILAGDPVTGRMREIASRGTMAHMEWKDDSILRDIDTPEDYRQAGGDQAG
jgi:molybdenum cofactor cytidylyltransferase